MVRKFITFIAAMAAVIFYAGAKAPEKMEFKVANDGTVSVIFQGKQIISPSPIGLVLKDDKLLKPVRAVSKDGRIAVSYGSFDVILDCKDRENGSIRLSVASIPDYVDAFIFGPFVSPDAVETGEYLGAAWQKDGSAVCIQSLNPKTMGECCLIQDGKVVAGSGGQAEICFKSAQSQILPSGLAAGKCNGNTVLSCCAINYTRPHTIHISQTGMKEVKAEAIPAPEGSIKGAAIALTCASDGASLLEDIGKLETEEGLPHPLIDGKWAKTSPRATDMYLIFLDGDSDAQIRMAERAGIHWIYFADPFKSWGHFGISPNLYKGGREEFRSIIGKAKEHGINIGFHTLSNFISTADPYVSPVPDKGLLAFDPVRITSSISAEDTDIHIAKALNYNIAQTLGAVRIGNEIITFGGFDNDALCLRNCKRGAFGTKACAHKAGETITHLADHGYGTLFPSAALQPKMAGNIGDLISYAGILRMSFDGMEGCLYTGHGEYGCSAYVQNIYDKVGNGLICDASTPSHYRWHAHSYFNWGEPWYDYQRRGGMFNNRVRNMDMYQRNLIPNMLGWYVIYNSKGRFEPTLPESVEHILSLPVAFNAGLCFQIEVPECDKLNSYLDMIRLWQEFREKADVPDNIRDMMKNERSDWHLEKKDGKWILSEMFIQDYDLGYTDRSTVTESGSAGYFSSEEALRICAHRSNVVIDRSSPDKRIPYMTEPFHCRIRVGNPQDNGKLHTLRFCGGWYSGTPLLAFDNVTANAGDYLEYKGGKTLYRYDKDYNLIEKIEGTGTELIINGASMTAYTVDYNIEGEDTNRPMQVMLHHIRTRQTFEIQE